MTSVVPLWMQLLPIGVATLALPWSFAVTNLQRHRVRAAQKRLPPDAHWSERARVSFSARSTAGGLMIALPIVAGTGAYLTSGALAFFSPAASATWGAFFAFVGAFLGARSVGESLGFRSRLRHDVLSTLFVLQGILMVALTCTGMRLFGAGLRDGELPQVIVGGALAILGGSGGLLRLVRVLGGLYRDPRLEERLDPLFRRAELVPQSLLVLRSRIANAYAFPLRKRLVVTERLLEILSDEELEAVVAHELGHLREGRRALVRVAVPFVLGVLAFGSAFVPSNLQVPLVLGASLAVLLAALLLRRWSQRRELEADEAARNLANSAAYARALEKIYEVNLYPAVTKGGVHPSLYDRLLAAGVTPSFPKPEKPERVPVFQIYAALLLTAALFVAWPTWLPFLVSFPLREFTAVTRSDGRVLAEFALQSHFRGNYEEAAELYSMAEQLEPDSPWYSRNLATSLIALGRCAEARAALERAETHLATDPQIAPHLGFSYQCEEGVRAPRKLP